MSTVDQCIKLWLKVSPEIFSRKSEKKKIKPEKKRREIWHHFTQNSKNVPAKIIGTFSKFCLKHVMLAWTHLWQLTCGQYKNHTWNQIKGREVDSSFALLVCASHWTWRKERGEVDSSSSFLVIILLLTKKRMRPFLQTNVVEVLRCFGGLICCLWHWVPWLCEDAYSPCINCVIL